MMAPPIPINRIKTNTIVSPKVCADLVGRMNAPAPAAAPSINALIIPDAKAKKTIRYTIAATITSLELFDDIE